MPNPWDKWLDVVDLNRRVNELSQFLLEAEGKVAVLTYERDVAVDALTQWEMHGLEASPAGLEARIEFYRDLFERWRAEAMRLRGVKPPYDGEVLGDF